jgi:photosystem II stability/assembly factor-like uncharacterized protein
MHQPCRRGLQQLACGALLAAFLPAAAHAAGTSGTWVPLAPGGSRVQALASAAGSPTVYAATAQGGVFRTVDRGATWQEANSGLLGFDVQALAIAAGGAPLYAATESGVFRSDDGAASWRATAFPGAATAVALAPGAPSTVYAAAAGSVYRSDDGGGGWTQVLTYAVDDPEPAALAVDAGSPQHVYFATTADVPEILISRSGGAAWRRVPYGIASRMLGLAADPAHPGTVYAATDAGLLVSRNGGGSWAPVPGLPAGTYTAVGFAIGAPGTLWAATDKAVGRLWKSTDGGATWTFVTAEAPLTAIAGDPLRPQRVYAATAPEGVLHGTFTAGTTPQLGTIAASAVTALAVDAQGQGPVYAYGQLAPPQPPDGRPALSPPGGSLRRSTDGGATWSPTFGLPPQGLLNVLADPMTGPNPGGGRAYALAAAQGPVVEGYYYSSTPLLHTSDAGATWQTLSMLPNFAFDVAVAPSAPHLLYAAGYSTNPSTREYCPFSCAPYVATSADGGATWTYNPNPLPITLPSIDITATGWFVRIHPTDARTVYISEVGNLIKTTDGGQTWTLLAGVANLLDLAIDPQQPARLYAVLQDGTATASTDGGQTWQTMGAATGLPQGAVRRIVAGPAASGGGGNGGGSGGGASQVPPLYAATAQGAFASFDRGASWALLGSGLANTSVLTVGVDPVAGTVFAGVEGGGGLFVLSR